MKITKNILSIPPYFSIPWSSIRAFETQKDDKGYTLNVTLENNSQVQAKHLSKEDIEAVFAFHATVHQEMQNPFASLSLPIKGDLLTNPMCHNPEQANLPPLPPEVLEKIVKIVKALGIEICKSLQQAEPHCSCMYCQVSRAIDAEATDEEVTEEDLRFKNWDVAWMDGQLYQVSNPLDKNEQYQVYLGNPLGCTCGYKNCEHIQAVLQT